MFDLPVPLRLISLAYDPFVVTTILHERLHRRTGHSARFGSVR